MKFDILKDFKGSPDGRFAVDYKAGTSVELSETLAATALANGWAKQAKDQSPPPTPGVDIENKAVSSDGSRKKPPAKATLRRSKKK